MRVATAGRSIRNRATTLYAGLSAESARDAVVGVLLGLLPVGLRADGFLAPGYPSGSEVFSNLIPALLVRRSLAAGELPVRTDLFFDVTYQFANPLWYGFYPFAWPLFVPGLPLPTALKVVLAGHFVAAVAVTYFYARKEFVPSLAAPLALVWLGPLALHANWHFEKIFAWPWFALLVWQLLPRRVTAPTRRYGLLAGGSLGLMLLAGANYYAVYAGVLTLAVAVALRGRQFLTGFLAGSLVGFPHLLSVALAMDGGLARPGRFPITAMEIVPELTGVFLLYENPGFPTPGGYAVVGLPAVFLAAAGLYDGLLSRDPDERRWSLAIAGVIAFGAMMATRTLVYELPLVSVLRTARRATTVVAVCCFLLVWYAASRPKVERSTAARWFVAGLLVVSAGFATYGWVEMNRMDTVDTSFGDRVAAEVEGAGCESVWIERSPAWAAERSPWQSTEMAFSLVRRGIAVRAFHYGHVGQEYSGRDASGELTFDALVTHLPVPGEGDVAVSPEHTREASAVVARPDLALRSKLETERGPVYVYEAEGGCSATG